MGSEVSKDFKAAIMNKFKELKETRMAVTEYIVSLNKEVEIVKKTNQMGHSLTAWSEEVNISSLRNYKSGENCQNIYNIYLLKLRTALFKQNTWNSPGKWEKWKAPEKEADHPPSAALLPTWLSASFGGLMNQPTGSVG